MTPVARVYRTGQMLRHLPWLPLDRWSSDLPGEVCQLFPMPRVVFSSWKDRQGGWYAHFSRAWARTRLKGGFLPRTGAKAPTLVL